MSEQQVRCSHCHSTKLEAYNSTTLKCQECEKFTQVEKNLARRIGEGVVITLGVSTIIGTIGFLVGGPPGAVAGAVIVTAIFGGGDTIG